VVWKFTTIRGFQSTISNIVLTSARHHNHIIVAGWEAAVACSACTSRPLFRMAVHVNVCNTQQDLATHAWPLGASPAAAACAFSDPG